MTAAAPRPPTARPRRGSRLAVPGGGTRFPERAQSPPCLRTRDADGFREVAGRSAAPGLDGEPVPRPGRIEAADEPFSPSRDDDDHAEPVLDASEWHTSAAGGAMGAAMPGDEMIDEAARTMRLVAAGEGRAAGMTRTRTFDIPEAWHRCSSAVPMRSSKSAPCTGTGRERR